MLEVHYVPSLVIASIAVAIMASFTSLRLTSGLGVFDARRRKVRDCAAAVFPKILPNITFNVRPFSCEFLHKCRKLSVRIIIRANAVPMGRPRMSGVGQE